MFMSIHPSRGQIHMFINNPLTMIPHVKTGRVRGIAVTGNARLPSLPQIPTFTEGGVAGVDVNPWFCLLAPAGTPVMRMLAPSAL